MEEQDHRRYDELYAQSHHELVLKIMDAEACLDALRAEVEKKDVSKDSLASHTHLCV